jgi:hypothetical protein
MKDLKSNVIEIKDQSKCLKTPAWFNNPDSFNKDDFRPNVLLGIFVGVRRIFK